MPLLDAHHAPAPQRRTAAARAQLRDLRVQNVEGVNALYYLRYDEFSEAVSEAIESRSRRV